MRSFIIATICTVSAVVALAEDDTRTVDPPIATTSCETGARDMTVHKAFTVQVCNLFGSTCYLNHPAIDSEDCETDALEIAKGECKLYPIYEYADNKVRDGAGVEHMSTQGDLGCVVSTSSSNGIVSVGFSGACVSVSCSLGDGNFAGPAYRGTTAQDNSEATRVTDTATHTFLTQNFASFPLNARNTKTVFLSRTGDFVGTTSNDKTISNDKGYFRGDLPTSQNGFNYGPVSCPSANNAMDSSVALGITAEELSMCGSTSQYAFFFGVNLVRDADLYVKASGTNVVEGVVPAHTSDLNYGKVSFLGGEDKYYSGAAMDDARKVYLTNGDTGNHDIFMSSDTITPQVGTKMVFIDETGGAWRSFGVAFYCKDYARTDLTVCNEDDLDMFYFCDPNPNACYGTATQISSNVERIGAKCIYASDCCSGDCTYINDGSCAAGCEKDGDYPTAGTDDSDDGDDNGNNDGGDGDGDELSGSSTLHAIWSLLLACSASYALSA